ncbi:MULTISPECIES: sulfite exporter TauE/SafE family protein [unclassified Arcicella]|uniref:sulfite exporter TauE/SafE family protein n=1 Tax=unclassified Arcicella TaxID=2644986 RepID=UPI00285B8B56|nr:MULTISPECIES: sulfite exporter TauE/SafE family protein [unclassified Arcicella]MDR6560757.1 sulfite exporter TauE/SafE [Arcicella sp. BE51]MDR6810641.1 sulfite exporter TauE/SafE [Arcicella sp. BE140]MDR6821991.1 sulfite exporter TauE/SafE [Arcicella sp. BE139]
MNVLFSIAFMTGLAGSFHCVGMCGPIALALPVGKLSYIQATLSRIFYNLGRTVTYGILGYIFGYFGGQIFVAGFQQQLSISIGLLMLIFMIPNKLITFYPFQKIPSLIKRSFGSLINTHSLINFAFLGMLNGLLPCGTVYLALAGATVTTSPIEGAIFMAFFGLGTSPLMFSVSILPKFLSLTARQKINKYLPVYSFVLASFFIVRGLNLGIPYISPKFEKVPLSQKITDCHGKINN